MALPVLSMLRRRLASCALVLLVCQSALTFAAPLSSCCPSRTAAADAAKADDGKDCCPAGSHPPGQCPLHAKSKTASKVSCRMQCDAPHGAQFLLGAVGMMPPPAIAIAAPVVSRTALVTTFDPETRPFVPDSPPPRLR